MRNPVVVIVSFWLAAVCSSAFLVINYGQDATAFGLSSSSGHHLSRLLSPSAAKNLNLKSLNGTSLCHKLGLSDHQKTMCRQGNGIPEVLRDSVRMAVAFCQSEFRYERWNCSLDKYHPRLLQEVYRETAILYAFTAASVEHAVSRGCSAGRLRVCHCAASSDPLQTRQIWKWGGCGDNLSFGRSFTDKFLGLTHKTEHSVNHRNLLNNVKKNHHWEKSRTSVSERGKAFQRSSKKPVRKNMLPRSKHTNNAQQIPRDSRFIVDGHNNRVGQQVVENMLRRTCKCHGVSGSCTVQTCWNQLSSFDETARHLKSKYDNAVRVDFSDMDNMSNRNKKRGKVELKLDEKLSLLENNKENLVYVSKSPDFCGPSHLSPGTTERTCQRGKNCDVLCCGRGYNVHKQVTSTACNCKLISCCKVECSRCLIHSHVDKCK